MPEYIARISYGKDSLKMLDVIHSRGLPLDRITTTDVWATDTISANLPPVEAFKAKMDQWIWDRYRIEVEHLCARNKDGSKKTYEQMFYHVPVRRSQTVQVEREREPVQARLDPRISRSVEPVVSSGTQTILPAYRKQGTITGFSPNSRYNWCQKLKCAWVQDTRGFLLKSPLGAENSKSTMSEPLFRRAPHEARGHKYRGISWNSGRRTETAWAAEREKACATGRVRY